MPSRSINISEQRIIKKGLLEFKQRLADSHDKSKLLEFPRRKNGSSFLMQGAKGFFERLLNEQAEVQTSMASDVSAAQSDLKYLTLQQHLAIRSGTLDFQTKSKTHEAHNSFLQTIDRYLFIELAKYCLGLIENHGVFVASPISTGGKAKAAKLDPTEHKLFSLGMQVVLVLGAVIESQEDDTAFPPCWVVPLDPALWDGKCMALFHSENLWIKIFEAQTPEVSVLSKDEVNIVRDTSKGNGAIRQLNWEVVTLNPSECNLLAEIGDKSTKNPNALNMELQSLTRRCNLQARAEGRAVRATIGQSEGTETAKQKDKASVFTLRNQQTKMVLATSSSPKASAVVEATIPSLQARNAHASAALPACRGYVTSTSVPSTAKEGTVSAENATSAPPACEGSVTSPSETSTAQEDAVIDDSATFSPPACGASVTLPSVPTTAEEDKVSNENATSAPPASGGSLTSSKAYSAAKNDIPAPAYDQKIYRGTMSISHTAQLSCDNRWCTRPSVGSWLLASPFLTPDVDIKALDKPTAYDQKIVSAQSPSGGSLEVLKQSLPNLLVREKIAFWSRNREFPRMVTKGL